MSYKIKDIINVLETNLDDCTGEILGYIMDKLLENGAKDVFFTPIYMKKNRPAYKLTVICDDKDIDLMEDLIFSETTSIGIRKRKEERTILNRNQKEIDTPLGKLKVKEVETANGERVYVEFESAKELAIKNNVPLNEIYRQI